MAEPITSLLGDLQRLVEQISDGKNKQEGRPVENETSTSEPDPARALSDNADVKKIGEVEELIIDPDGRVAGVVIGLDADKNNTMALERVEVKPEADGRVRITVLAKKDQHR
jgi:hypothetical protein